MVVSTKFSTMKIYELLGSPQILNLVLVLEYSKFGIILPPWRHSTFEIMIHRLYPPDSCVCTAVHTLECV
jgi:hypothetical protein